MSTPRRQTGFFYNIWHGNDTRIFSTIKDCPFGPLENLPRFVRQN